MKRVCQEQNFQVCRIWRRNAQITIFRSKLELQSLYSQFITEMDNMVLEQEVRRETFRNIKVRQDDEMNV